MPHAALAMFARRRVTELPQFPRENWAVLRDTGYATNWRFTLGFSQFSAMELER
jgi:hypothetical protein